MFNLEKAIHMSAFLLDKRGGRMSYLKLMKMLYIADREALQQCGESLSGDRHYSMQHGPILSNTYDCITGDTSPSWNSWFQSEANREISLKRDITADDLDELSPFDIEILSKVWEQHGNKTRWEIVDYTHDHMPEWEDPGTSSRPIDPRKQFLALGKTPEQAEALNNALIERRALQQALAEIC